MNTPQANGEFAVSRARGMDRGKARRIAKRNAQRDDMYWTCPGCGETLTGTISEIEQEHEECHSQCQNK